MRTCSPSDKKSIEDLFSDSIYQNNHLGWLDLWQLPDAGGAVRLFENRSFQYLIGIQPVSKNIHWLHSFYSNSRPSSDLNMIPALKTFFGSGIRSIYTISSHRWYSELLVRNGFTQCDEIIEFETEHITISNAFDTHKISSLSDSMITSLMENCEQAFPYLWRLSRIEMETALSTADYKKMIGDSHNIRAYILADLSDNNCHILRLSTEPEYQNTGLATCLIRRMVLDCSKKEINGFSVNTNKKNSAAVKFYQSLNFVQLDRVYPVYHRYL